MMNDVSVRLLLGFVLLSVAFTCWVLYTVGSDISE